MENRNILMVIISISALFVIVFGIALMITWPKGTSNGTANQLSSSNSVGIISGGPILKPTATPQEPQKTGELPAEDNAALEKEHAIGDAEAEKQVVPDIEVKVTEAEETKTANRDASGRNSYTVVDNKKREPVADSRRQPVVRTEHKTVAVPKNYPKRVTEYWIQAGSFKSRTSAENQNNKLIEKGFPGQVKTRVINDTTYYRVRIGPYNNKKEAGKFLTWIREIPDLTESYISETYVIR